MSTSNLAARFTSADNVEYHQLRALMRSTRSLTPVCDDVWITTSRHYQTASTIIARGGRALLVDPAWDVDELEALAASVVSLGLKVACGFHTHAHFDHLLWHPALGLDVPRWAGAVTCDLAKDEREELLKQLGPELTAAIGDLFADVKPLATSTIPLPFGDGAPHEELAVIEHDGHAEGHCALWLPERGLLIAGDMLSDLELPLAFNQGGIESYLEALDRLEHYVELADYLITGHGTPTDKPRQRLDADRRLLNALLDGREVDDRRRASPGGEEAYQQLKSLAALHRAST